MKNTILGQRLIQLYLASKPRYDVIIRPKYNLIIRPYYELTIKINYPIEDPEASYLVNIVIFQLLLIVTPDFSVSRNVRIKVPCKYLINPINEVIETNFILFLYRVYFGLLMLKDKEYLVKGIYVFLDIKDDEPISNRLSIQKKTKRLLIDEKDLLNILTKYEKHTFGIYRRQLNPKAREKFILEMEIKCSKMIQIFIANYKDLFCSAFWYTIEYDSYKNI